MLLPRPRCAQATMLLRVSELWPQCFIALAAPLPSLRSGHDAPSHLRALAAMLYCSCCSFALAALRPLCMLRKEAASHCGPNAVRALKALRQKGPEAIKHRGDKMPSLFPHNQNLIPKSLIPISCLEKTEKGIMILFIESRISRAIFAALILMTILARQSI